ncbi:hypothetical protein ACA40_14020 [Pseudomonas syringae pv. lapsa]|nr:PIN domain-containing protein [Pseudomonas syringae]ALU60921.1 hypothetical protein ACA40_14020 [Pseudomonas syringae pv. lapsa]
MQEKFKLCSRYIFIDTSVFYSNNFQFSERDLESLTRLLNSGLVTLLITNITIEEVKRHIRKELDTAASLLQSFQRKGKILRNSDSFSRSPLFERFDISKIEAEFFARFELLLSAKNVEVVSIDRVSPEDIFRKYFSVSSPFSDNKPDEFRDAFVLEALSIYAEEKHVRIHVLSKDDDMWDYCRNAPSLLFSKDLGELVNAAVHFEPSVPLVFADQAYSAAEGEIISAVEKFLSEQDFGIVWDSTISARELGHKVMNIVSAKARVFSAEVNAATYGVAFDFEVVVDYLLSSTEEERAGLTMLEVHNFRARYEKNLEATVHLAFYEGDLDSVEVECCKFELHGGDHLWQDELLQCTDLSEVRS